MFVLNLFDYSTFLSSLSIFSYYPVLPLAHQLHLPRCGGQIPCALQLMRTLALLPSTTLSHISQSFQLTRSHSLQSFGGLWVFSSMKSLIDVLCTSFEISSHFSCLFTQMQICSTSRRLINFECCRVCPWVSLQFPRQTSTSHSSPFFLSFTSLS